MFVGFSKEHFLDINCFYKNGIQYINQRRLKDVYFVFNEIRNVIIIYYFKKNKDVALAK